MPLSATTGDQPFSAEDAWVYPFSAGVPGTGKDMPGFVSLTTDPQITEIEHRGDNRVISKGSTLDSIDIELVLGQWNLDALSSVAGGTYTATTGTTPNEKRTLVHKVTDQPADFAIKAQTRSKSSGGGGTRLIFPRCQPNGLPDYGFTDAEYQDLTIPIAAVAHTDDSIVSVELMETYAALTSTFSA